MREHNQLKHRGEEVANQRKKPQVLTATGPNEIYSWDITYLMSPIKGLYYYLSMVMDIYRRKIVDWQVHDDESSAQTADLMADIAHRGNIDKNQLVIHSGSS